MVSGSSSKRPLTMTLVQWSEAVTSSTSTQTNGLARIHSTFCPGVAKPYRHGSSSSAQSQAI